MRAAPTDRLSRLTRVSVEGPWDALCCSGIRLEVARGILGNGLGIASLVAPRLATLAGGVMERACERAEFEIVDDILNNPGLYKIKLSNIV